MARDAMDKDRLAAFVDGALTPEEAAAVVMHLADHPQDQAYVDSLIAANELLAAAFAEPLHEPVPEAIRAAIMGETAPADAAQVVPFRRRAPRAAVWGGAGLALAASLAAVAVLMPGAPAPSGGAQLTLGPVAAGSALARVIDRLPSLSPEVLEGGQEVMILATLRIADGRYCREVEIVDSAAARLDMGIACTTPGGGWTVELALQEPLRGDEAGFVTAAGPETQLLSQFLDAAGAGDALDPEAEARAIAGGWTR